MNNFNQSSNGVNLELSCSHDSDLARMWFEDNFKIIRHGGYQTTALLQYTEGGGFSDFEPCICIAENNIKEVMKGYIKHHYNNDARAFIEDFNHCFGSVREATVGDVVDFWDNVIGDNDDEKLEFLANYGEPNYVKVSAGPSRGDYCEIIVPKGSYAFEHDNLDFDNMVYSSPLHIRLTVNGEEYYIDSELKDAYDYDTTEVLEIADKLLDGHKGKAYILTWLGDNLPQYPETY